MAIRNIGQIPMYQARIPVRGGGGVSRVDTSEAAQANPIVEALKQMIAQKRQQEQDALARRAGEADIAYRQKATEQMGQPKQISGRVVVGGDKTWLVDPTTGEKRDLGIAPPRSKVGDRNVSDIINDMAKMSGFEDKGLLTRLGPEIIDTQKSALRDELMGKMGVEEVDEEYTYDPWWGKPRTKTRKAIRKKVESREVPAGKGTPITEALEEPVAGRRGKRKPFKSPLDTGPAGLEDIWPQLSDEDKKGIRNSLRRGYSVDDIRRAIQ